MVGLVDRARAERVLEPAVGRLALGDDHQAARPDVQSGDDALALARPRGGDAVAGRGQAADDGRTGPAHARVGCHPDGLVDDDEVVVVVDDAHPRHRLGDDLQRRAGLDGGQRHLEQVTRRHPVGLAGGLVVDLDVARTWPGPRPWCGRPRTGGRGRHRPVPPRGRRGRTGCACQPCRSASCRPCSGRVPSTPMPRIASTPMTAAAPDDGDVGDVADEPAEVVDEVDDVPSARPGARKSRSMRLPRDPPSRRPSAHAHAVLPSRRAVTRMKTRTPHAMRVRIHVAPCPMENAAPALRMRLSRMSEPDDVHGLTRVQGLQRPPLGELVEHEHRRSGARRDGEEACAVSARG